MLNSPSKEDAAARRARLEELERRQAQLEMLCEAALQDEPTDSLSKRSGGAMTSPALGGGSFRATRTGGGASFYPQDDLLTGEVQSFRDPASAARASSLLSSIPRDGSVPSYGIDIPAPRPSGGYGRSNPYFNRSDDIVQTPDSTRYTRLHSYSNFTSAGDVTGSRPPPPPARSESRHSYEPPRPPPRSKYGMTRPPLEDDPVDRYTSKRYYSNAGGNLTPPPPPARDTYRTPPPPVLETARKTTPPPPVPEADGPKAGVTGVYDTRSGKYSRAAAYRKYRAPHSTEEDTPIGKWRRQLFENEESVRPLKKKYGTPPPPTRDSPPRRVTPIASPSVESEDRANPWETISATPSEHRRQGEKLRDYFQRSEPLSTTSSFRKQRYPPSSSSRYSHNRRPEERYGNKKPNLNRWAQRDEVDTPRSEDLVERAPPPPPPEISVPRSPSVSDIDIQQAVAVASKTQLQRVKPAMQTLHPYAPAPTVTPDSFKKAAAPPPSGKMPPPPSTVASEAAGPTSQTRRPLGSLNQNNNPAGVPFSVEKTIFFDAPEMQQRAPQAVIPQAAVSAPPAAPAGAPLPQDVVALQKGLLEAKAKAENLARHLVKTIKEKKLLQEATNELETMVEETNLEVGRLQRIVEDQQKEVVTIDGLRAALRAKEEEVLYCEQEVRRLQTVVESHVERITEAGRHHEEKESQLLVQTEELQAALTEVGVAHVAQREAEARAEQLTAELEGAVEQIQELDERLAEMERQSASVWLTQLSKNIEGGAPPGVKLPDPQKLRQWPAEARQTVAELIATTKLLLAQNADKTSGTPPQQLRVLEHDCAQLKQQLREKNEQVNELQSECLHLKGDKNVLLQFSAEQLRQLRGVKDEAQLVSEYIRTSRQEAEDVVIGCKTSDAELEAHKLSQNAGAPFTAARQQLQEVTVTRAQQENSRSIRFAQQVMQDMHAVARFLSAVREMDIEEEDGFEILSEIANNKSPADKLYYITNRDSRRREPSPVVREKINERKKFVIDAIERALSGESPTVTISPIRASTRTNAPTELRSVPHSYSNNNNNSNPYFNTNNNNSRQTISNADPYDFYGEEEADASQEEVEVDLPANTTNFSNYSSTHSNPKHNESKNKSNPDDYYYNEDNGAVYSTSARIPLQSIRRDSEELERAGSSPHRPTKLMSEELLERTPIQVQPDPAEFAKKKFCSPVRMGAKENGSDANNSTKLNSVNTVAPPKASEATVAPASFNDSTPSNLEDIYGKPNGSSVAQSSKHSKAFDTVDIEEKAPDSPLAATKAPKGGKPSADPSAEDSLSLSDIPFDGEPQPPRHASKEESIQSLPARPVLRERSPLASPPREERMSSPDSSPIVHRDAPEPVIRRPDGPPTSRRLLTSPNRDSGPSQPKDRSATAPPRDSEEREIPSGEVQEVQPSSDAEVTSVPLMDENFILPSRNHNNNNNKQPPAASGAKFNKVPARPGYSDDSSSFSDEDYPPQTTSPKALPASLPPLHPNSLPASAKSSPAQSYIKANRSKPSENDTAKSSTSESKPPSKPIVDDDDDEEPSLSFFNSAHTPQGQERSNSNSGSRSSSNSDEQRREPAEQPAPASDSTGIAALPRLQRSAPPADSPVAPPRLQPAGPGRSNLSQSNSVNHTTTSQPAERSTTPDAVGPVLSEPQKPSPSRPTRRTTEITVDEDELLMEADEEEEQEPPSGKRDTVSPADLTERKEEITADEDSLEEPQEEKKKPSLGLPPMASGTPSLSEMPQPAAPLQPSPKPHDSGRKDLNSKESSPTPPPSLPRVNEDESGASLLQSRTADPTNVRNKGEAVAKPSAQSAASSVVSTPRSRTAELSEEDLKRKEEVSRILERIREKKELEKKRMETMSQSTDDN